MMIVVLTVFVMVAMEIFLRVLIEGCFAPRGAEIISRALVLRSPLGGLFVNFHFTNWINCH